jgi:hypothetical protein
MDLHVELLLPQDSGEEMDQVVRNLGDIDKIAGRVGRAVRDYLRTVPVRQIGSSFNFSVRAQWQDGAPPPAINGAVAPRKKARSHHGSKPSRQHKG